MAEGELKDWIRKQLEEGESRKVIRKALDRSGYDPSIVGKVETSSNNYNYEDNSEEEVEELTEDLEDSVNTLSFISGKQLLTVSGILAVLILGLYLQPLSVEEQLDKDYRTVSIGEVSAEPSNPALNGAEKIKFVNNASKTFDISFDRNISSFRLSPNETVVRKFNRTTYYSAKPVNEGRLIKGSIYVP